MQMKNEIKDIDYKILTYFLLNKKNEKFIKSAQLPQQVNTPSVLLNEDSDFLSQILTSPYFRTMLLGLIAGGGFGFLKNLLKSSNKDDDDNIKDILTYAILGALLTGGSKIGLDILNNTGVLNSISGLFSGVINNLFNIRSSDINLGKYYRNISENLNPEQARTLQLLFNDLVSRGADKQELAKLIETIDRSFYEAKKTGRQPVFYIGKRQVPLSEFIEYNVKNLIPSAAVKITEPFVKLIYNLFSRHDPEKEKNIYINKLESAPILSSISSAEPTGALATLIDNPLPLLMSYGLINFALPSLYSYGIVNWSRANNQLAQLILSDPELITKSKEYLSLLNNAQTERPGRQNKITNSIININKEEATKKVIEDILKSLNKPQQSNLLAHGQDYGVLRGSLLEYIQSILNNPAFNNNNFPELTDLIRSRLSQKNLSPFSDDELKKIQSFLDIAIKDPKFTSRMDKRLLTFLIDQEILENLRRIMGDKKLMFRNPEGNVNILKISDFIDSYIKPELQRIYLGQNQGKNTNYLNELLGSLYRVSTRNELIDRIPYFSKIWKTIADWDASRTSRAAAEQAKNLTESQKNNLKYRLFSELAHPDITAKDMNDVILFMAAHKENKSENKKGGENSSINFSALTPKEFLRQSQEYKKDNPYYYFGRQWPFKANNPFSQFVKNVVLSRSLPGLIGTASTIALSQWLSGHSARPASNPARIFAEEIDKIYTLPGKDYKN